MTYKDIPDARLHTVLSIMYSWDVINGYIEKEMRKRRSRPIRGAILGALCSNGGSMTPMALSKRLFRAPNSVTTLIDTLEQEGLVQRRRQKKDNRSVEVILTKKGRRSADKLLPVMEQISSRVLSSLNEEQINSLRENLRQIRQDLLQQLGKSKERKK